MNSWIWCRREDSNCASRPFHNLGQLFDYSKIIMIRSHYRPLRAGVKSVLGLQAGSSHRTMLVANGRRLASPGPAERHRVHARLAIRRCTRPARASSGCEEDSVQPYPKSTFPQSNGRLCCASSIRPNKTVIRRAPAWDWRGRRRCRIARDDGGDRRHQSRPQNRTSPRAHHRPD